MERNLTRGPQTTNLEATQILDFNRKEIRDVADAILKSAPSPRAFVQKAHLHLVAALRPVYSVDEWQPASVTMKKAQGSCSQRMACLEAIARAGGIATRVEALHVKGSFWFPRFRFTRRFIPKQILLLWPQFYVDGAWLDFDELHATMDELAAKNTGGFTNAGESLFEAVSHTPVDFRGKTCGIGCAKPEHDLSRYLVSDEGVFDSRDDALRRFGSFQFSLRGRIFELVYGGRKSS